MNLNVRNLAQRLLSDVRREAAAGYDMKVVKAGPVRTLDDILAAA